MIFSGLCFHDTSSPSSSELSLFQFGIQSGSPQAAKIAPKIEFYLPYFSHYITASEKFQRTYLPVNYSINCVHTHDLFFDSFSCAYISNTMITGAKEDSMNQGALEDLVVIGEVN